MNNISKLIISTSLITTSVLAQSTMCFKKNVQDITLLEDIKLNGGECKSAYSLNDMKKDGWKVSDIKINNNDYIYILKKGSDIPWSGTIADTEALEERLLQKMETKRKKEIQEKKRIAQELLIQNGKSFYQSKCQSCHGKNGEDEPHFSRKLKDLTFNDFDNAMNGYRSGLYDRGSATVMKGFALTSSKEDVINVYEYLKSINTNTIK